MNIVSPYKMLFNISPAWKLNYCNKAEVKSGLAIFRSPATVMCFCSRDANISSKQQWNYRNTRLGWYSWTDCDFSHVSVLVCTITLVQEGRRMTAPIHEVRGEDVTVSLWAPHPSTKHAVWLTSPHTISPHDFYITRLLTQSVHPTNTLHKHTHTHTHTHDDNRARCSRKIPQYSKTSSERFLEQQNMVLWITADLDPYPHHQLTPKNVWGVYTLPS